MGRRLKKQQQIQHREVPVYHQRPTLALESIPSWVMQGVLNLPRIVRIFVTALCALGFGAAIIQIIYTIYLQYFFSVTTYFIPTIIAFGAGVGSYVIGWYLIVGSVGEKPAERMAVFWYLFGSLMAVIIAVILFLFSYSAITAV